MTEFSTPTRRFLPVILTASGGAFLAMLDSTVTNLAVPNLHQAFPTATVSSLSWVISAYAVMFAALLAPAGRLADVIGRRGLFVAGVGLFTVASLLSALAPTLPLLIVTRALQGAGGAAMIPASLAILLLDGPADKRHSSIGIWSATSAFAAAIGPTVGGLLVEAFGWRSVFVINLPFGVLLVISALRLLARPTGERGRAPDPVGIVLATVGVAGLTLGVTEGGTWGWTSPAVLISFVLGAVSVVAAILRSRGQAVPAIDSSLWANRTFTATNVVSLLYGLAQYPWILGCVLFLSNIWRYSELRTGLAMAPGAVVGSVAALAMGRLAPRLGGPRFATLLGLTSFAACAIWFVFGLPTHSSFLSVWLPGGTLIGLGMGSATTGTSSFAAMSAPPTKFATASGLNTTARQFGGALGVATLAAILALTSRSGSLTSDLGYHRLFIFCAVAVLAALAISAIWLRNNALAPAPPSAPAATTADRVDAAPSPVHDNLPGDRHLLVSAEPGVVAPLEGLRRDREPQGREAFEQHAQPDFHLDASQRRADAEVRAVTEGHLRRGIPVNVKRVRITEQVLVATRGAHVHYHGFLLLDERIPDPHVLYRDPVGERATGVVQPQQLLDRVGPQARVLQQLGQRIGVAGQGEHRAAQHGGAAVVTSDQQRAAQAGQFVLGKLALLVGDHRERLDQAGVGVLAIVGQFDEVVLQLRQRRSHLLLGVLLVEGKNSPRPPVELLPVDDGHAEHLAYHAARQWPREHLVQVDGRGHPRHVGQQLPHDQVDVRPQLLHPTCGERLRGQLAYPGVPGRVHVEQAVRIGQGHLHAGHSLVEGRRPAEPVVGQHGLDVLVLHQQPGLIAGRQRDRTHRPFTPQFGVFGRWLGGIGPQNRIRIHWCVV
jgi:EmrB/QacA subfamily drug resistance transporter